MRASTKFWVVLVAIVLFGLGVRLYGVFEYRPPCEGNVDCTGNEYRAWGDALFYHLQANDLADGEPYLDPIRLHGPTGQRQPSAGHPPLYSTYLAAWSFVGADTVTWHRVASTFLGAGTVLALALLARRLAGDGAAIATAAVGALAPALWVNDYMLLSESMAGLMVALALWGAYEFARKPDLEHAVLMGGTFALAALSRAEVALLFVLVAIPLAIRFVPGWRERAKALGVCFVTGIVVLAPWVGFNLARFDEPTFLSTGAGATISAGSCDLAWYGTYTGWYWCGFQQDPDATETTVVPNGTIAPPLPRSMDESERDIVVRDLARDYVLDHLGRLPVVAAARVGRLWYVYAPAQTAELDGNLEGRGPMAGDLVWWTSYVLVALGAAGMYVMWRRRITIAPIVGLILAATFAAATTFGVPRYRIPADVGLVLASGIAVAALCTRAFGRQNDGDDANSSARLASEGTPVSSAAK